MRDSSAPNLVEKHREEGRNAFFAVSFMPTVILISSRAAEKLCEEEITTNPTY